MTTHDQMLSSPPRLSGAGVRSRVIVPCRRIGLRGTFEYLPRHGLDPVVLTVKD